jgi:hypothetical protein
MYVMQEVYFIIGRNNRRKLFNERKKVTTMLTTMITKKTEMVKQDIEI